MDALLQWASFFKNKGTDELKGITIIERGIIMAKTLLSRISQDDIQRVKLLQEVEATNDYLSGITHARNQGLKRGLNQGLKLGRNQGLELGGRNALIQTARNMKVRNYTAEDIFEITGLSKGEY